MSLLKYIENKIEQDKRIKRNIKLRGKCACCLALWKSTCYDEDVYDCGCIIKGELDYYCKLPLWFIDLIVKLH